MNTTTDKYQRLYVSDISCASCVNTIETAVSALPGVDDVEVNFAERTVNVSGDVGEDVLINAIAKSGYTACSLQDNSDDSSTENQDLAHHK